ncbi:MAG: amidohydrolase family protein, partial [Lutibacter sp.]|nr:amidohydrolase family protein [Lutibacter sp.]
ELQIVRDLFLLEYTGGKLHIPTISTVKSVELIKEAKKKKLNITCSVAAHHLVLTDDELKSFNTNTKVLPPLRTSKDVKALIKGIKEGVIDMVTSDHNPMDVEHKKVEYSNAKFGTIGLESLFGALNKTIGLETLIGCLTTKPRERFNVPTYPIAEGQQANITLFNPDFEYTFTENDILSTSKNAIFLHKNLNGKVYGIISNNKMIAS